MQYHDVPLQPLLSPELYSPELLAEILGPRRIFTVPIANRWLLGWPDRVAALLESGTYLECLKAQTELEKETLLQAYEPHLADHEILALYEVKMSPPLVEQDDICDPN